MKIPLPTQFPTWRAAPDKPYTSDIVRSRNIRLEEISLSGEVDVQNQLSLTSSQSDLVTAIFVDPDHLVSFATKKKSYYIDNLTLPTPTQYSLDLAAANNLNPKSSGIVVYPRGYSSFSHTAFAGTTIIGTAGITVFADVTNFSRTYTYAAGQQVVGVRMQFTYTQGGGHTNIVRIAVVDAEGTHVVQTDPAAHAGGHPWDYWFVDGAGGCNLNETGGFTVKVQVATDGAAGDNCTFTGNTSFDFMYEVGTSTLVSTGNARLYVKAVTNGTPAATALYPGGSSYSSGYLVGYPQATSIFADNYPAILEFFNDRVMLIGNGSHVHWVDTTNYVTPVADPTTPVYYTQRLQVSMGSFSIDQFNLPDGYVIQWMDSTPDTVYIGAVKYNTNSHFDQVGKSYVVMWQPSSGSSTYYEVNDGECIGRVYNNYLYILTNKGNIFYLYNGISQLQFITKIYQMPDTYTIQLPHPNGVDIYENKLAWLIPGNKYAPAGIYVFDQATGNVYHKHSPYSTGQQSPPLDVGGNQPQVTTGALMFFDGNDADMFLAGLSNVLDYAGSFIGGLFDSLNIEANNLSNYGYVEFGRIKTSEVDSFADGYALKYRGNGTIYLAQKKYETFLPTTDGLHVGNWGSSVTDPATFTMTSVPTFMKKGDRITVLDGTLAGFSTTIKSITGTTITIDPVSKFNSWTTMVGDGAFTFLWERLGYKAVFTNNHTLTVDVSVIALMEVGDELEFTAGLNAGYLNYITAISGTTVTLLNNMNFIAGNYTLFNIDEYTFLNSYANAAAYASPDIAYGDPTVTYDDTTASDEIMIDVRSNSPLSSDFVQFKMALAGDVKIRDFQVNVKPNQRISNDVQGAYYPPKKK